MRIAALGFERMQMAQTMRNGRRRDWNIDAKKCRGGKRRFDSRGELIVVGGEDNMSLKGSFSVVN